MPANNPQPTKGDAMLSEKEYQQRELRQFYNQKCCFFDTVKEFSDSLEEMDILEQVEWIENGSYGAGACLALQAALNGITPRCNAVSRIGSVVLQAFYGAPFRYWKKLSQQAQTKTTEAVSEWLKQSHNFGMTLKGD